MVMRSASWAINNAPVICNQGRRNRGGGARGGVPPNNLHKYAPPPPPKKKKNKKKNKKKKYVCPPPPPQSVMCAPQSVIASYGPGNHCFTQASEQDGNIMCCVFTFTLSLQCGGNVGV